MNTSRLDFKEWPLDLLLDYALKVHHRTIRREGPITLALAEAVAKEDPRMSEVKELFAQSLSDLENHLMKEEQVLFPYLYELFEAAEQQESIPAMHCGTISHPIRVMLMEHDGEMDRHSRIAALTNDYAVPQGASDDYVKLMKRLKEFRDALLEHIHIENDLIFPGFEALEPLFSEG